MGREDGTEDCSKITGYIRLGFEELASIISFVSYSPAYPVYSTVLPGLVSGKKSVPGYSLVFEIPCRAPGIFSDKG